MGKLLLALRYGSIKTKITLISLALLLIGGGALLVMGINSMSFIMLGVGALMLVGGLLFIFSLSVIERDAGQKDTDGRSHEAEAGEEAEEGIGTGEQVQPEKRTEKKTSKRKGKRFGRGREHGVPANREYAGVIPEWQNDIIVSKLVRGKEKNQTADRAHSDGDDYEIKDADIKSDAQIKDFAERGVIANVREQRRLVSKKTPEIYPEEDNEEEKETKKNKKQREKKRDKRQNEAADTEDYRSDSSDRPDYDMDDDDGDEYDGKALAGSENEKPVATKKQIQERKKLLKVKGGDKKYTPVYVDSFRSGKAEYVPAYIQTKGKTVNIILIEGTLRTIVMPLNRFIHVRYERSVPEHHSEYYDNLRQDAELSEVFGDLLPSLYRGTGRNVMTEYKNRYILGSDLAVSPRSMRLLMKKFDLDYHVFDSLEIKGEYTDYFKMAYENRIFWTDNCITQTEYQNRTRRLLQMMVDDDSIAQYDFQDDLELMVKYKLITQEYADYYKARKKDRIKIKI